MTQIGGCSIEFVYIPLAHRCFLCCCFFCCHERLSCIMMSTYLYRSSREWRIFVFFIPVFVWVCYACFYSMVFVVFDYLFMYRLSSISMVWRRVHLLDAWNIHFFLLSIRFLFISNSVHPSCTINCFGFGFCFASLKQTDHNFTVYFKLVLFSLCFFYVELQFKMRR